MALHHVTGSNTSPGRPPPFSQPEAAPLPGFPVFMFWRAIVDDAAHSGGCLLWPSCSSWFHLLAEPGRFRRFPLSPGPELRSEAPHSGCVCTQLCCSCSPSASSAASSGGRSVYCRSTSVGNMSLTSRFTPAAFLEGKHLRYLKYYCITVVASPQKTHTHSS